MISWKFCKKIDQNSPVGCVKLSFGISGRTRCTIFLGYIVVCLLCWLNCGILNIWSSMLSNHDWIINKITLDLCQNLICNILNPLVGCVKLAFGTGGGQKCWFLPSFPVVCYLCWLNNGVINIYHHKCYVVLIEWSTK